MTRADLEHIIRAAAANADTDEIVIVGSQAILGSIPNPPDEICQSIEADVYPKDRPETSILIDGAIGEHSVFHKTFGYYAHGVAPDTAMLPKGALERLIALRNENTKYKTGWCLEPHDLAASKLIAGRDKDIGFVRAMLKHNLIEAELVRERLKTVADDGRVATAVQRLDRIIRASGH